MYQKAISHDEQLSLYTHALKGNTVSTAHRHYNSALDANPTYSTLLDNYAVLLGRQGRFKEARMHFRRALHSTPNHPLTHYNLACLWGKQARPQSGPCHQPLTHSPLACWHGTLTPGSSPRPFTPSHHIMTPHPHHDLHRTVLRPVFLS